MPLLWSLPPSPVHSNHLPQPLRAEMPLPTKEKHVNEFWWGVLALPIIALAVAAGAAAIFGSWLLFEKWATDRLKKLPPVHVSQKLGDGKGFPLRSATQLGGRGIFAALFLSVDKAWFLRLGPNTGISIVHGKGNQQYDTKFMHRALQKAIDDIAVAEQEAEAAE